MQSDLAWPSSLRITSTDIFEAYKSISERRLVECYHDALQAREQALQMFNLGYLGLEPRSIVEREVRGEEGSRYEL